jgi:hypothetical protein
MGPVGCPEMSVGYCHYTLRHIPAERRSHLLRNVLKRKSYDYCCIESQWDCKRAQWQGQLALPLSSQYLDGCDKQQLGDICAVFLHEVHLQMYRRTLEHFYFLKCMCFRKGLSFVLLGHWKLMNDSSRSRTCWNMFSKFLSQPDLSTLWMRNQFKPGRQPALKISFPWPHTCLYLLSSCWRSWIFLHIS